MLDTGLRGVAQSQIVRRLNMAHVPVVALMGVLQLILVLQPDFGTVVLLGSLAVSMMFLAGC